MKKFIYTFLTGILVMLQMVQAQVPGASITASGTIVDKDNKPVAGVSILIQERTTEKTSAADGSFSIECTTNDIIILKKQGYNTLQKPAAELNGSTVQMQASLIDAGDDDDVYIPFGVRKRRTVSASVSSIKGSSLPQLPLSTLNNVLAGRLPGLYVQQTGTRPGTDDATFLIRGRSSYNSNQQPLVLVDGVARDFVNMDLNEIESISVLKDAASLSWYGMNAANGVIYVTTKRGSATATRISLDVQGGVQSVTNITKPVDAFTYASLYNQAVVNNGGTPVYSQAALDAYKSGSDPYAYPNNNLVDRFIKKAAPVQRYVATVSGGNAFVKYFTLLSYYNQDGLYKGADNPKYSGNSNYQRYNFRTNLNLHINKTLDVVLDAGGRVENLRYMAAGNASFLSNIYSTPSNAYALINPNGTYGGSSLFRNNPLAMLNADGNLTDLYRTLLATLSVKQKLDFVAKGLSANVFYTYDITGFYQSGFDQGYEVYEYDAATAGYTRYGNKTPLVYQTSTFNSSVRNNELWAGVDYERTFGKHGFNISTRFQRFVSASSPRLDNKGQLVAGRLSYNYDQKYFADVVASYAGSQTFSPSKRYGFFPALSLGWIASEEKFMKPVKFIDFFKLRGSVGIAGNDALGARRFAYNNYFTRGGTQYFFGTGYTNVSNTEELELANPNLTWEKALKASIGFDAKFFGQAIDFSFDYFYENRTDLLTSALLPNILGQQTVQVNEGEARLQGFEAAIAYTKKLGKVNLQLRANYTYAKDRIISLNEEPGIPAYQSRIGSSMGSVLQGDSYIKTFLIAEGLFQSQAEIDAAPVQRFSGTVKPGDIRYKDINGDNVIDNLDYVMTNYSDVPRGYYGFGSTISYEGFDCTFQFQGVHGRTISINNIINSGTQSNGYINQFSIDSWMPGKENSALYPRMAITDRGNNTVNSTYWLRSGDYVRLKSAEIGYTLSAKAVKKLKINSCRFYVTGFNLITFSKLSGLPIDPEMPGAGFGSNYPYLKTFAAGFSLNF